MMRGARELMRSLPVLTSSPLIPHTFLVQLDPAQQEHFWCNWMQCNRSRVEGARSHQRAGAELEPKFKPETDSREQGTSCP